MPCSPRPNAGHVDQSPMLHVNEARVQWPHHRQPQCNCNLRLSPQLMSSTAHYCTTPLSLQLSPSVPTLLCNTSVALSLRWPLTGTLSHQPAMGMLMSQAGQLKKTKHDATADYRDCNHNEDSMTLLTSRGLHGSVNWHLHCTREVISHFM